MTVSGSVIMESDWYADVTNIVMDTMENRFYESIVRGDEEDINYAYAKKVLLQEVGLSDNEAREILESVATGDNVYRRVVCRDLAIRRRTSIPYEKIVIDLFNRLLLSGYGEIKKLGKINEMGSIYINENGHLSSRSETLMSTLYKNNHWREYSNKPHSEVKSVDAILSVDDHDSIHNILFSFKFVSTQGGQNDNEIEEVISLKRMVIRNAYKNDKNLVCIVVDGEYGRRKAQSEYCSEDKVILGDLPYVMNALAARLNVHRPLSRIPVEYVEYLATDSMPKDVALSSREICRKQGILSSYISAHTKFPFSVMRTSVSRESLCNDFEDVVPYTDNLFMSRSARRSIRTDKFMTEYADPLYNIVSNVVSDGRQLYVHDPIFKMLYSLKMSRMRMGSRHHVYENTFLERMRDSGIDASSLPTSGQNSVLFHNGDISRRIKGHIKDTKTLDFSVNLRGVEQVYIFHKHDNTGHDKKEVQRFYNSARSVCDSYSDESLRVYMVLDGSGLDGLRGELQSSGNLIICTSAQCIDHILNSEFRHLMLFGDNKERLEAAENMSQPTPKDFDIGIHDKKSNVREAWVRRPEFFPTYSQCLEGMRDRDRSTRSAWTKRILENKAWRGDKDMLAIGLNDPEQRVKTMWIRKGVYNVEDYVQDGLRDPNYYIRLTWMCHKKVRITSQIFDDVLRDGVHSLVSRLHMVRSYLPTEEQIIKCLRHPNIMVRCQWADRLTLRRVDGDMVTDEVMREGLRNSSAYVSKMFIELVARTDNRRMLNYCLSHCYDGDRMLSYASGRKVPYGDILLDAVSRQCGYPMLMHMAQYEHWSPSPRTIEIGMNMRGSSAAPAWRDRMNLEESMSI